jgi:hypothetical protein
VKHERTGGGFRDVAQGDGGFHADSGMMLP